jgi:hypothetical protein
LDDQASPRAFSLTSGPQAGRDCWLRVQSGGWPGCGIFTPHRLPAGPASQWFGSSERCSVPLNCGADADGARTVDLAATSRTGGRWWISSGDGWVGDAEGREGMARAPRMPQCRHRLSCGGARTLYSSRRIFARQYSSLRDYASTVGGQNASAFLLSFRRVDLIGEAPYHCPPVPKHNY